MTLRSGIYFLDLDTGVLEIIDPLPDPPPYVYNDGKVDSRGRFLIGASTANFTAPTPDGGLFRAERYRDVHIYGLYADGFLRGEIPYRDVFVEYPPGAFVVFLPPAALPGGAYNAAFTPRMALCGIAALFAVSDLFVIKTTQAPAATA